MTFSPLETLLAGAVMSIVTALAVRVWTARSFITRVECDKQHRSDASANKDLKAELRELKAAMEALRKMIRALVLYSDMTPEKKKEILDEEGL